MNAPFFLLSLGCWDKVFYSDGLVYAGFDGFENIISVPEFRWRIFFDHIDSENTERRIRVWK